MVPRWQLPPIANPYFIGWYGAHTPSRSGFETVLVLQTQTMETDVPAEDLAWWYGRGIMGCPWSAGTQVGWLNTVDDFVGQFKKAIKAGHVGVCLDELVGFDAETQRLRGTPERKYRGNLAWIEKWIKYYREHFPQMPGVFFYPHPYRNVRSAALTPEQHKLIRHCDRLVKEYYIDPAPKVSIAAPRDGMTLAGTVHVDARADRPAARWRLYVGAEMVEENESGKFEIPNLAPGPQILTVHAITADWLRGASQIQVSVAKRGKRASFRLPPTSFSAHSYSWTFKPRWLTK